MHPLDTPKSPPCSSEGDTATKDSGLFQRKASLLGRKAAFLGHWWKAKTEGAFLPEAPPQGHLQPHPGSSFGRDKTLDPTEGCRYPQRGGQTQEQRGQGAETDTNQTQQQSGSAACFRSQESCAVSLAWDFLKIHPDSKLLSIPACQ